MTYCWGNFFSHFCTMFIVQYNHAIHTHIATTTKTPRFLQLYGTKQWLTSDIYRRNFGACMKNIPIFYVIVGSISHFQYKYQRENNESRGIDGISTHFLEICRISWTFFSSQRNTCSTMLDKAMLILIDTSFLLRSIDGADSSSYLNIVDVVTSFQKIIWIKNVVHAFNFPYAIFINV